MKITMKPTQYQNLHLLRCRSNTAELLPNGEEAALRAIHKKFNMKYDRKRTYLQTRKWSMTSFSVTSNRGIASRYPSCLACLYFSK